jgi:aminoglycoside phosphotransferase (APT) family kinase protein
VSRAASADGALADGQFSRAVLIDGGTRVARYPRHAFGVTKLARELVLLREIAGDLPLPVSVAVDARLDISPSSSYVVHDFIPGRALSKASVDALDATPMAAVARSVGSFLAALHAIPWERVPREVPRYDDGAFADELRSRCEHELFPLLDGAARRRASAELAALRRLVARPSVLCHADIGGNVIYDEVTGGVGVIDFGEAMVAEPVYDVASLSVLGDTFVRVAADAYPLLGECLPEASVVRATFVLQDALGGASQQDWAYVEQVLRGYGE